MTTKTFKPETVLAKTGKTWEEWLKILNDEGAKNMSHKEIASMLSKKYDVEMWWSQGLTVEYERHIGRRVEGQQNTGKYQFSVSKTIHQSRGKVFKSWEKLVSENTKFDKKTYDKPRISSTGRSDYWRSSIDESLLLATITAINSDKASITVTMEDIGSLKKMNRWKLFWRDFLDNNFAS